MARSVCILLGQMVILAYQKIVVVECTLNIHAVINAWVIECLIDFVHAGLHCNAVFKYSSDKCCGEKGWVQGLQRIGYQIVSFPDVRGVGTRLVTIQSNDIILEISCGS